VCDVELELLLLRFPGPRLLHSRALPLLGAPLHQEQALGSLSGTLARIYTVKQQHKQHKQQVSEISEGSR